VDPVFAITLSVFTELLSAAGAEEEEEPLHPVIKEIMNTDKKMEANRFICYFLKEIIRNQFGKVANLK
jgi:hypothetical protein